MRILATSLPKSGTFLLVRLLELLGFSPAGPQLSASLVRLTDRNPFRRLLKRRRVWHPGMDEAGLRVDLDIPENRIRESALRSLLARVPTQSFLTGHLPYSPELEAVLLDQGFRVLFIIRDPRDVALSLCNYVMRLRRHPLKPLLEGLPTLEQRLRQVIDGSPTIGGFRLAPLPDITRDVLGWCESPRVAAIRFEDLIGPKGGGTEARQLAGLKRLMDYLGLAGSDSELARVAAGLYHPRSQTFFKGMIGQWREAYSPPLLTHFNAVMEPLIRRHPWLLEDSA
jgi:hypothetical protein